MGVVTAAAGIAAAGSIASAAMARRGGSSGSTQTQMPEWMQNQYRLAQSYDTAAAARTADQATAALTPDQLAAMQKIRDSQGFLQPDMASAQARATTLSNGITPDDIAKFQNPYTSSVINAALADINRQRDISRTGINSAAEAASAFGGDRAEVAKNLSDDSYIRAAASTDANLRDQGFNTAVNTALASNASGLSGNAQVTDIINARRSANANDTSNLLSSGTIQQQQDQKMKDWAIQQGQIAGAHIGTGVGGTTNYTTPGADIGSQISMWGTAANKLTDLYKAIYAAPTSAAQGGPG